MNGSRGIQNRSANGKRCFVKNTTNVHTSIVLSLKVFEAKGECIDYDDDLVQIKRPPMDVVDHECARNFSWKRFAIILQGDDPPVFKTWSW